MSDNALAGIQEEGKIEEEQKEPSEKSDEQEKETPASSPEEKKPVEEKPSQEGEDSPDDNLPFHKHPRWKEVYEKAQRVDSLEEEIENLRSFREETEERLKEEKTKVEASIIPAWFKEVFGEQPDTWGKYQSYEKGLRDQIKQEVLETYEAKQVAQQAEVQRWNQWVEDGLVKLEGEGKSFNRNELLQTALDYTPTDQEGNIDLAKAYKIYETFHQKEKTEKSDARKKIAAQTTSDEKIEPQPKEYMTAAELRGKSFLDLAH